MTDGSDGIHLIGSGFTVSASEKVSTGEYESHDAHITINGEIPTTGSHLDDETRADLKEQLLQLHGDLQAVLNKAAGNRIADPDFEDWTFGEDGPEVRSVGDVEEDAGAPTNEH